MKSRGKLMALLGTGLLMLGISPLLIRFAPDVPPAGLAALRALFAVILLLPFWWKHGKSLSRLKADGIGMGWMMLAGFSLGLHFILWITSLHYTSVASASVLVTTNPAMLILAESLLFRRRFGGKVWLGVTLACAGSVLLGYTDRISDTVHPDPVLGNSLAFSAAIIFVFYFLIGSRIRQRAGWIDYVFHVYLHAALISLLFLLIFRPSQEVQLLFSLQGVVVGLSLAIGPTIIGHGSMNYAVKFVSPTVLSTLILSEIVISALGAWLLFAEIPSPESIGAMLFILLGVALTWSRNPTR